MKLGVNLDHIATLRNARMENDPVFIELAIEAMEGGADQFTVHLREDRRHIREEDLEILFNQGKLPINLELSANPEMLEKALDYNPYSVCIVPENRNEVTTEGGLDLAATKQTLASIVPRLIDKGMQVFLFIEPSVQMLKIASELRVSGVEIHTGTYARSFFNEVACQKEWQRILDSAVFCKEHNLEFHAGHGLNYQNVHRFQEIDNCVELNIGHAIISRALKTGLRQAVKEMKVLM